MEFNNNDNNERKPPNRDQLGLETRLDGQKSNTVLKMIEAEEKKRNSIMPGRPSAIQNMRPLALPGGDEQVGRRLTIGRPSRLQPSKSGTFQRRVSNYGATGPLAGRNSVNVRKTSVVLTKFDEAMPIGSNVRRVSAINNNLQPNNQNMHNRRVSNIGRKSIIPMTDPMMKDQNPWTIENPERRESKNNAVANVIRKMSTNIKAAMSTKEEESMVRVSRFLWIFSLLCLLLSAASAVLAFFQVHIAGQICLSLVKLIALILAWLLPRKILSKSFAKSLEKSQRFQNLQNVFIQKEIQEFNRDLETQGIW
jgi:uncharacterized protein (UPF0147 family)